MAVQMEEAKQRKLSVVADPEGLRYVTSLPLLTYNACTADCELATSKQSLLEGKRASDRLKVINHQMEEAASQGVATDELNE